MADTTSTWADAAAVQSSSGQRLRDEAGSPIPPAERAALSRDMGPVLAALPPAEARDARAEGESRSLEDIIASALKAAAAESDEVEVQPASAAGDG